MSTCIIFILSFNAMNSDMQDQKDMKNSEVGDEENSESINEDEDKGMLNHAYKDKKVYITIDGKKLSYYAQDEFNLEMRNKERIDESGRQLQVILLCSSTI